MSQNWNIYGHLTVDAERSGISCMQSFERFASRKVMGVVCNSEYTMADLGYGSVSALYRLLLEKIMGARSWHDAEPCLVWEEWRYHPSEHLTDSVISHNHCFAVATRGWYFSNRKTRHTECDMCVGFRCASGRPTGAAQSWLRPAFR